MVFAGGQLWVADRADHHVYIYDINGTRAGGFPLSSQNAAPMGMTLANDILWVVDHEVDRVFAYHMNGTLADGLGFELALNDRNPSGIAFYNDRLWVVDYFNHFTFAYGLDGTADPESNFELDTGNTSPTGIAFGNDVLWSVNLNTDRVYTYNATDGSHTPESEFLLDPDNASPAGVTFATGMLWVVDDSTNMIHSYDTDGMTSSEFQLGSDNTSPTGITFATGMLWVVDDSTNMTYSYDTDGTTHETSGFKLDAANSSPAGITYIDSRFWIVDDMSDAVYTYGHDGTMTMGFKLGLGNATPTGITFSDGKFWVTDSNDTVYAYESVIGALVPLTYNSEPFPDGAHWKFATEAAVSDFNDYLERKEISWRLSLDLRDTAGDAATTLDAITAMRGTDGLKFFTGPSFSGNLQAIMNNYTGFASSDMLLVSPASTAPDLAEIDNVYRLAVSDDKQGQVIADMLHRDGKKIIVPVWVDNVYGIDLANATVNKFRELGGVADFTLSDDMNKTRSYDQCQDGADCLADQFPDMAQELAETVTKHIRSYGSDRVAVVFAGYDLLEFVVESDMHPILRTVQWMGSDADVLRSELVANSTAREFLTDVNFRAASFSGSEDTARYDSLKERLNVAFPNDTPSIYAYSSYDAVWAIGLAMEAAGGPYSSFDKIASQIGPAIDGNDEGALGDIMLDKYGDIATGNYAVWGVEPDGWERIATFSFDGPLDMTYEEQETITIGALLSLDDGGELPSDASVFLDDQIAVAMALSRLDYNSSADKQIDFVTINTASGAQNALDELGADAPSYFIGPTTSANLAEVKDYINEENRVTISPSSTATTLSEPDSIFRLSPNNAAQVPTIAGMIESGGNKHVVIVQRDDLWAQDIVTRFTQDGRFASYHVMNPKIPVDVTSFDFGKAAMALESDIVDAISASDADSVAVFYATFLPSTIELFQAFDDNLDMSSRLYEVDHYGADALANESNLTDDPVAGRIAYELGLTGPLYSPADTQKSMLLAERLDDLGIRSIQYHVSAYDSVHMLADAASMSTDVVLTSDVLASSQGAPSIFPYPGALGSITLDMSGDLQAADSDYAIYTVMAAGCDDDITYSWHSAWVSGTVFSDTDGDGMRDAAEPGYPGYCMLATDGPTGSMTSTLTASDGTYSIGVVPGSRTLVQTGFFPTGHTMADPNLGWHKTVMLDAGQTDTLDVGFHPVQPSEFVTLNLHVFEDRNGNGEPDATEGVENLRSFHVYTYTIGPKSFITGPDGMTGITDQVPADFGVFVDTEMLAQEGHTWSTTSYVRSDDTSGKQYDSTFPVADDPAPGSVHTMLIGLVPSGP